MVAKEVVEKQINMGLTKVVERRSQDGRRKINERLAALGEPPMCVEEVAGSVAEAKLQLSLPQPPPPHL